MDNKKIIIIGIIILIIAAGIIILMLTSVNYERIEITRSSSQSNQIWRDYWECKNMELEEWNISYIQQSRGQKYYQGNWIRFQFLE